MPVKKKTVSRVRRKRTISAASAVAAPPPSAPVSGPEPAVLGQPFRVPRPQLKFGGEGTLFPTDRPILGSDVQRLKEEAGFDLNAIEASLGVSRREQYYNLLKRGNKPLPDFGMAILMRLYELYPNELLPFQPVEWMPYLQQIGAEPTEFAQLVGRHENAGRVWQRHVAKPHRSVQLLIEAFVRGGVTHIDHPVYRDFRRIALEEASRRGNTLEVKTAARSRRPRRSRQLVQAEASLMIPVDD